MKSVNDSVIASEGLEVVSRRRTSADWRLYAAAGVAALAASSGADASIIYVNPTVKPDAKIPGAAPYSTGGATKAFTIDAVPAGVFINAYARSTSTASGNRMIRVRSAAAGIAQQHAIRWAVPNDGNAILKRFAPGQAITAGHTFGNFLKLQTVSGGVQGQFASGQTGIAGFELPATKGGGFGWMRFEMIDRNGDGYPDEVEAIDWAYNTATNGTINAGQTAPEPAALALLAIGSAGVLAWRRRRTLASASPNHGESFNG